MNRLITAPLLLLLAGLAPATAPTPAPTPTQNTPATTTSSPAFLALVPDPAAVVKLSGGYRFLEGPTWLAAAGELVFSDIPADTQYIFSPAPQPTTRVFRKPSGNANGTALLADGSLIVCRHGPRDVIRVAPSGEATMLATHFDGKRLNSPNDAVVAPDGTVFFTDPPWGVRRDARELDFCGVYALSTDGTLTLLARDLAGPNGIALSPDGSTLYVTESWRDVKEKFINAYPLTPPTADNRRWSAGAPRRFYTVDKGTPDGIRVDVHGNLWTTAGDGVHVVSPEGQLLGRILTPETPANLTFGGPDGNTLFITARTSLYSIRTTANPAPRAK